MGDTPIYQTCNAMSVGSFASIPPSAKLWTLTFFPSSKLVLQRGNMNGAADVAWAYDSPIWGCHGKQAKAATRPHLDGIAKPRPMSPRQFRVAQGVRTKDEGLEHTTRPAPRGKGEGMWSSVTRQLRILATNVIDEDAAVVCTYVALGEEAALAGIGEASCLQLHHRLTRLVDRFAGARISIDKLSEQACKVGSLCVADGARLSW